MPTSPYFVRWFEWINPGADREGLYGSSYFMMSAPI